MKENQNSELLSKLNAYANELDRLVNLMKASNLSCGDAEMIYAEVSSRIRQIIAEAA